MVNAYNTLTGKNNTAVYGLSLDFPSFIDNTIVHGEYTKGTKGHVVKPPTSGDFDVSHDRSYRLIEGEEEITLTHNNDYNGLIFQSSVTSQNIISTTAGDTVTDVPLLIYSKSNPKNRIAPSKATKATKGNKLSLQNMKGRSLADIGFEDNLVKLGQSIDIGFRTTDLAMKIADQAGSSINSTKVGKGRHSTNFLSHSFFDVDAITAMRFISKHDGQSIRGDRFGNLHYTHQNMIDNEHYLSGSMITGGTSSDNIAHTPNRVTVYGKQWANNMDNVVRVEDKGRQKDGVVNEVQGGIYVPTASTEISAQRIGQRLLATANRAKSIKQVKGIIKGSKISPGHQIKFTDGNQVTENIVLETKHDLTNKMTDVTLSAVAGTIEDMFQKFQEDGVSNSSEKGTQTTQQINTINLTTSDDIKITSKIEIKQINRFTKGIIIGSKTRGRIHGRTEDTRSVSVSKSRIGTAKSKDELIKRG